MFNGNVSEEKHIEKCLDLFRRVEDVDSFHDILVQILNHLLSKKLGFEQYCKVFDPLFDHQWKLLEEEKHYLSTTYIDRLLSILFMPEAEPLSKRLDKILQHKLVKKIHTLQSLVSTLCSSKDYHQIKWLKSNECFLAVMKNYAHLVLNPEQTDKFYPYPVKASDLIYSKILLFLISNRDWPPSLDLLKKLLLATNQMETFDSNMDLMSEMKIQNNEHFKTYLRFTISTLEASLIKYSRKKKVSKYSYRNILKLVRILFKSDCFSDVLSFLLSSKAFQINGALHTHKYKKRTIFQYLIVNLKPDFGMKNEYGSLILLRAQHLKVNGTKPQLTWRQPEANIRNHPAVTAFLQGDDDTFIYRNIFPTVEEAKRWIRFNTSIFHHESDVTDFTGIARSVDGVIEVILQKGRYMHQRKMKKYYKQMAELERFKRELKFSFPALFQRLITDGGNKRHLEGDFSNIPLKLTCTEE